MLPKLKEISCAICNLVFRPYASKMRCCSYKCGAEFRARKQRKGIIKKCETCMRDMYVKPCRLQWKRNCSMKCQGIWKSKNSRGNKAGGWKGGITPLNEAIRNLLENKLWRVHCLQRDDYICYECKKRGGELHVDHIIPFSFIIQTYKIKTVEDARKCEFLWDIRNGRTLCVPCHQKTFTFAGRNKSYVFFNNQC